MATIAAEWIREGRGARYTRVAVLLHWLIAAAILYNLASGLLRPVLPRGFFVFHISSGITILVLSVVRVAWRLTHKPPPFLPMKTWEARLAHGVHVLLYAAMLILPFSGWAMVSANPPAGSPGAAYAAEQRAQREAARAAEEGKPAPAPQRPRGPTMIWGVFKLPLIASINEIGRAPERVGEQHELHERIETFHAYGGWVLLFLFMLHVAGALKHQLADREPELQRMRLG